MEQHYKMKLHYKILFSGFFLVAAIFTAYMIYDEVFAVGVSFDAAWKFVLLFSAAIIGYLYFVVTAIRKEIILSEDWIESIQIKRTKILFREIDRVVLETGRIDVYGNSRHIEIPRQLENFADLRSKLLKKTASKVEKGGSLKGEIQF